MQQTLKDVEFLFIDDASPDDSRAILERVIAQYPDRNVRIITHSVNKGLPAARNTGLEAASGDFIYHCDSDDWIEADLLERMYNTAISEDADYVYCDFFLSFGEKERYMKNPTYTEPEQMIKEGFMAGLMKYNVWNKLVRRELYTESGIRFPEGHGMGEDMTMILLAAKAHRVAHVSKALYHYVKLNTNAYSNTFSQKHIDDIFFNLNRTMIGLSEWDVPEKEKYLAFFKLNTKLPLLFSDSRQQNRLWKEWFPEANPFICLNKYQPFRTRLVQWLASRNLFAVVSLYRFLINRVYYGIRYHAQ